MKYTDFVAVDFETMTNKRTSACAIGMAKVKDGIIVDSYYSLIKPIPDDSRRLNTYINHITMDMVEDAPDFKELFPSIVKFVGDGPLVCHNKSMEQAVFRQCMEYYNLNGLDIESMIDTYYLFKARLEDLCNNLNIDMGNRHNALDDAKSCAKLLLTYDGEDYYKLRYPHLSSREMGYVKEKNYRQKSDIIVDNKDTLFYKKRIVITGTFERFYDREKLKDLIYEKLGGLHQSVPNSKTDIVIIGSNPGPKKKEMIDVLLRWDNEKPRIIDEKELYEILGDIPGSFDNASVAKKVELIDPREDFIHEFNHITDKSVKSSKNSNGCLVTIIFIAIILTAII